MSRLTFVIIQVTPLILGVALMLLPNYLWNFKTLSFEFLFYMLFVFACGVGMRQFHDWLETKIK